MRIDGKWLGAGLLAAAGAAAGAWYLYERATEKPNHRVILADGDFELRAYPALLVAEAVAPGGRERALNRGFSILADYIFAKTRGGEKIAMTAPVLADRAGRRWRTRFIMPGKWTRSALPAPPAGVTIDEIPARRVAAVRFAGKADDALLAEREAALRHWMESKALRSSSAAEHAFYNAPFVPGPLRRNEVLIPIG